jgi:hypothetical protein
MLYPWENFALSGSIALEFVGHDHARYISQSLRKRHSTGGDVEEDSFSKR